MENNKKTLEDYEIRENEEPRLIGGFMGLVMGAISGEELVVQTLKTASEMYNSMQTNADFSFYNNLNQFYSTGDRLETILYVTGIIIGGALLSRCLFAPKYEIYKENEEK